MSRHTLPTLALLAAAPLQAEAFGGIIIGGLFGMAVVAGGAFQMMDKNVYFNQDQKNQLGCYTDAMLEEQRVFSETYKDHFGDPEKARYDFFLPKRQGMQEKQVFHMIKNPLSSGELCVYYDGIKPYIDLSNIEYYCVIGEDDYKEITQILAEHIGNALEEIRSKNTFITTLNDPFMILLDEIKWQIVKCATQDGFIAFKSAVEKVQNFITAIEKHRKRMRVHEYTGYRLIADEIKDKLEIAVISGHISYEQATFSKKLLDLRRAINGVIRKLEDHFYYHFSKEKVALNRAGNPLPDIFAHTQHTFNEFNPEKIEATTPLENPITNTFIPEEHVFYSGTEDINESETARPEIGISLEFIQAYKENLNEEYHFLFQNDEQISDFLVHVTMYKVLHALMTQTNEIIKHTKNHGEMAALTEFTKLIHIMCSNIKLGANEIEHILKKHEQYVDERIKQMEKIDEQLIRDNMDSWTWYFLGITGETRENYIQNPNWHSVSIQSPKEYVFADNRQHYKRNHMSETTGITFSLKSLRSAAKNLENSLAKRTKYGDVAIVKINDVWEKTKVSPDEIKPLRPLLNSIANPAAISTLSTEDSYPAANQAMAEEQSKLVIPASTLETSFDPDEPEITNSGQTVIYDRHTRGLHAMQQATCYQFYVFIARETRLLSSLIAHPLTMISSLNIFPQDDVIVDIDDDGLNLFYDTLENIDDGTGISHNTATFYDTTDKINFSLLPDGAGSYESEYWYDSLHQDLELAQHPHTGKFIFTYRAFQGSREVGSISFYESPILCRSKAGNQHNLYAKEGIFNDIIIDTDDIEEICASLPPTFWDNLLHAAIKGGFNGALRGASSMVSHIAKHKGYTTNTATILSKISYYLMYFIACMAQNNVDSHPQEGWINIVQIMQQTATVISIDACLTIAQILMRQSAHQCYRRGHEYIGKSLHKLSACVPFGLLAYQAHTQGVVNSSVGFASAVAANQAVEYCGTKTIDYLMN